MEVSVIKITEKPGKCNVVVSRRAIIESKIEEDKMDIISKLNPGDMVKGLVKNFTPYGAFVVVGCIQGLAHIGQLSYKKIDHPSEVLKLGEMEDFVILSIDKEKMRIQLAREEALENPVKVAFKKELIKEGQEIQGVVSGLTDSGFKVILSLKLTESNLEEKIELECFCHISEMMWFAHPSSEVKDFYKVGEGVKVKIVSIDPERGKVLVSAKGDSEEVIKEKYDKGTRHTGIIKKANSDFILIALQKDVYGTIYVNDLSWTKKIKRTTEFSREGEEIEVLVLEPNFEKRILKLGHKQLSKNPWENYSLGDIYRGKIKSINEKGAIVEFDDKVEGFAPYRFLEKKDGSRLKEEEEVDFKIIELRKDFHQMILSHVAIFKDEEKKDSENKKSKSTLGDKFGSDLIEIRKK